LILRSVSGGVTPSTSPCMTDEFLVKVHQTPSVTCRSTLRSVSRSLDENLLYPLGMDSKRHDTYIILFIFIYISCSCYASKMCYLTYSRPLVRGSRVSIPTVITTPSCLRVPLLVLSLLHEVH